MGFRLVGLGLLFTFDSVSESSGVRSRGLGWV